MIASRKQAGIRTQTVTCFGTTEKIISCPPATFSYEQPTTTAHPAATNSKPLRQIGRNLQSPRTGCVDSRLDDFPRGIRRPARPRLRQHLAPNVSPVENLLFSHHSRTLVSIRGLL